jgi:hypothetical protein
MQLAVFLFRLIFALSLCLFISGCDQRMQTVQLSECNGAIPPDATVEMTNKIQGICHAKANIALSEKRLAYDLWSLEHRSNVLFLQNIYTAITLALVIVVLLGGLIFAAIEFRQGKDSENTIKIGASGLEVSSKFIGIVVLALSLGFSYLFLEKAYPVSEVSAKAAATK